MDLKFEIFKTEWNTHTKGRQGGGDQRQWVTHKTKAMQNSLNKKWNGKLRGAPITSFRHSGDRENSEYFSSRWCLEEGWIIYFLIKNPSGAYDKKGQRGIFSATVNTLYSTWKGTWEQHLLGRWGSSALLGYNTAQDAPSQGPTGPLTSRTEKYASLWDDTPWLSPWKRQASPLKQHAHLILDRVTRWLHGQELRPQSGVYP